MFFSTRFYILPGMILADLSNILLKPEILSAALHKKHQDCIHENFTSKDVSKWQIAVATYLIHKLVLRVGNEKVYFV